MTTEQENRFVVKDLSRAHYIFIHTGQGQGRLKVNLNCLQVIGYVFLRYNNYVFL